jgi:hypothetical protein
MKIGEFDPIALRQEKQLARERDERDLREGRVSAEELRMRNGLFSGFDFSRARIRLGVNRKRRGSS